MRVCTLKIATSIILSALNCPFNMSNFRTVRGTPALAASFSLFKLFSLPLFTSKYMHNCVLHLGSYISLGQLNPLEACIRHYVIPTWHSHNRNYLIRHRLSVQSDSLIGQGTNVTHRKVQWTYFPLFDVFGNVKSLTIETIERDVNWNIAASKIVSNSVMYSAMRGQNSMQLIALIKTHSWVLSWHNHFPPLFVS